MASYADARVRRVQNKRFIMDILHETIYDALINSEQMSDYERATEIYLAIADLIASPIQKHHRAVMRAEAGRKK